MGSSAPGGGNEFHVLRYENKAPGELFARCARWAPRQVGQVASPGERQVGSKWAVIHSLYIPYIFPRYVPCIFPCVFLNLWNQEKTHPYRKTTFLLQVFQILRLLYLY